MRKFIGVLILALLAMGCKEQELKNDFVGLAHINIRTKDIDKSVEFYTRHLGFEYVDSFHLPKPDGTVILSFVKLGNCVVELMKPSDTSTVNSAPGIINHYAIEVNNIEQRIEKLKQDGVTITRELFQLDNIFKGIKGAFIEGPSGESIELFEYIK